jgi:hypothetical protein
MPPERRRGRRGNASNLTEAQKGAIVTLRKVCGMEFAYMAGALNMGVSTPGNVYRQIEKACIEASREPTIINLLDTAHLMSKARKTS